MTDQGYDADLTLWAESQARALRDAGHAGTNLPIDWENVAEEIESLGKSQARELASRIRTILVHLLKLEGSPVAEPRAGWRETIQEQRNEIEAVLLAHPKVLEAAVVSAPDGRSGESPAAFIVRRDASLTEQELRAHCAGELTAYKRPTRYEFRDALPKTPVGKVLRRALRDEARRFATG